MLRSLVEKVAQAIENTAHEYINQYGLCYDDAATSDVFWRSLARGALLAVGTALAEESKVRKEA